MYLKSFVLSLFILTSSTYALAQESATPTSTLDIQGTIQGYKAARNVGDFIAKTVYAKTKPGSKDQIAILLTSRSEPLEELGNARSMFINAENLLENYKMIFQSADAWMNQSQKPSGGMFVIVTDAIRSHTGQFVSYFNNSVKIGSGPEAVGDQALNAMVFNELNALRSTLPTNGRASYTILVEGVRPTLIPTTGGLPGKLQSRLEEIAKLKSANETLFNQLKSKQALGNTDADEATKYLKSLDSLDSATRTLSKFLTTPDRKTGLTPLEKIGNSESIANQLAQASKSYHLYVKTVATGGFQVGSGSYQGGAVVTYYLFDQEGLLIEADTVDNLQISQ